MQELNKKKIRLILPGGGFKGTFQLGFIKALQNSGKYEIDHVYGTSIGALIAPFALNNDIDEAIQLLNDISSLDEIVYKWPWYIDFLPLVVKVFFKLGAYKRIKIHERVIDALRPDFKYDKCSVVAWDLLKKRNHWFKGNDLKIGLHASSNLWLLVPPLRHDDSLFIDAGVTEYIPEDALNDNTFDGIYVIVDCVSRSSNPITQDQIPTNVLELLSMLHNDTQLQLANKTVFLLKERYNVVDITPKTDVFEHPLEINKSKMDYFIDMGMKAFETFHKINAL